MNDHLLKLEDVIEQLRLDLKVLEQEAEGNQESLRFAVEEVELEFQVGVTKAAGGSGKVSVWVVELGGEGSWSKAQTQTVRMKLRPRKMGAATPVAQVQPPAPGAISQDDELLISR